MPPPAAAAAAPAAAAASKRRPAANTKIILFYNICMKTIPNFKWYYRYNIVVPALLCRLGVLEKENREKCYAIQTIAKIWNR